MSLRIETAQPMVPHTSLSRIGGLVKRGYVYYIRVSDKLIAFRVLRLGRFPVSSVPGAGRAQPLSVPINKSLLVIIDSARLRE